MKITPVNNRILATKLETKATKDVADALKVAGTNAELDKFMFVKVVKSDIYKKGQILAVPSYVDTIQDKATEYFIFHESDVVATCEDK